MNRRSFIASIPFAPSAVKAVAVAMAQAPLAVAPVNQWAYQADARGIHQLLTDCGKCVDQKSIDLNDIFERIYALKRRRNSAPAELWVRVEEN